MPPTTHWSAADVAGIARQAGAALPRIAADALPPSPLPGHDLWDMWQLARADGATVLHRGRSIWFFLAAPQLGDPDLRHDHARIRTLTHGQDGWRDHGPTFPDDLSPGSREWSGSALLHDDGRTVTMYFTAAGRRGEPRTFEQRLFETQGTLDLAGDAPRFAGWTPSVESLAADGRWYRQATETAPTADRIKGFRDPGVFRDPLDGQDYLLWTGSASWADDVHDGVIGLARREDGRWVAQPPLLEAIGVNSELERAHLIARDGLYYLFWSTQRHRFAPGLPGVTGLYAQVADRIEGPWRPVNGTGLVAANPADAPTQAYCWWVTGELDVISFVDIVGDATTPEDAQARRARFGGVPAPWFRLAAAGDRIGIAPAPSAQEKAA